MGITEFFETLMTQVHNKKFTTTKRETVAINQKSEQAA
jgi:hypothetical protein